MNIKALLAEGRLPDAVAEVTTALRTRPADAALRVSLFELLALQGEWDRALKHLDVLATAEADTGTMLALQVYRDLVAAERQREEVFAGRALPKFVHEPPAYLQAYVLLVHEFATAPAEAAARIGTAEEATPALAGSRSGAAFDRFRDSDDRIAPVLELFHGGSYAWLPLDSVQTIDVTPPKRLRDLIWVHATITTADETIDNAFVPGFYAGSARAADMTVRAGHRTDFTVHDDRLVTALGPRVFLVDDDEIPLVQLGTVRFGVRTAEMPA
jgi:type VI secretion system protein ImpE